jgi:hypothetical protein
MTHQIESAAETLSRLHRTLAEEMDEATQERRMREEMRKLTAEQLSTLENEVDRSSVASDAFHPIGEKELLKRICRDSLVELRTKVPAAAKKSLDQTHQNLGAVAADLRQGDWSTWALYGSAFAVGAVAVKWAWDHTGGWVFGKLIGTKEKPGALRRGFQASAAAVGGLLGMLGLHWLLKNQLGGTDGLRGGPVGTAGTYNDEMKKSTGKEGTPAAQPKAPTELPKVGVATKNDGVRTKDALPSVPEEDNKARERSMEPEDVFAYDSESVGTQERKRVWELRLEVLPRGTAKIDATLPEQRWYRNVRTGTTYTAAEILARFREVKEGLTRQHLHGEALLSWKMHGRSPVEQGDLLKALATAARVNVLSSRKIEPGPDDLPKVLVGEDRIVYKHVDYYTPDGLNAAYKRAHGLYNSREDFDRRHRTLNALPQLDACELNYRIGSHTALPLAQIVSHMSQPKESRMRLHWPVEILGFGTKTPCIGNRFLLPEGRDDPIDVQTFLNELTKLKNVCGDVEAVFEVTFMRTNGSVKGDQYQGVIDTLQDEHHNVFLNDLQDQFRPTTQTQPTQPVAELR